MLTSNELTHRFRSLFFGNMSSQSFAAVLLLMSSVCFCQNCPSYTEQDIVNEFNDTSLGVAFSMLSAKSWENPDTKPFFVDAPTAFNTTCQQDMSIATRVNATAPYQADGQYGLLFHIGATSNFWKFFQVAICGNNPITTPPCEGCWCGKNDTIVAGPGDGMINNPSTRCRTPIVAASKDYAWFTAQKNHILNLYKMVYPTVGNPYNEFDVNGLSKCDLAGAMFSPGTPASAEKPNETALCSFLHHADPERQTWPLYQYTWDVDANTNKLEFERHLNCSFGITMGQHVVHV